MTNPTGGLTKMADNANDKCVNKAIVQYLWGGTDESFACEGHFNGLLGMSQMMGWPLPHTVLSEDSKERCRSVGQLEDSDDA